MTADTPVSAPAAEDGAEDEGLWAENLVFEAVDAPEPFARFDDMCVFHQTSGESPFQQGLIATRATESGGRVTLGSGIWAGGGSTPGPTTVPGYMLSVRATAHAPRVTQRIPDDELAAALAHHFGIHLPPITTT